MLSIWSSLAELPDPRSGNARRHKLLDVLTIALTASICGAESCVDFVRTPFAARAAIPLRARWPDRRTERDGTPSGADHADSLTRFRLGEIAAMEPEETGAVSW